jgi:hypothetical protein
MSHSLRSRKTVKGGCHSPGLTNRALYLRKLQKDPKIPQAGHACLMTNDVDCRAGAKLPATAWFFMRGEAAGRQTERGRYQTRFI